MAFHFPLHCLAVQSFPVLSFCERKPLICISLLEVDLDLTRKLVREVSSLEWAQSCPSKVC